MGVREGGPLCAGHEWHGPDGDGTMPRLNEKLHIQEV